MRVAWVPLAVLVVGFACAGLAVAQESAPPQLAPVDEQAPAPKQVFQSLKNFGSFGANAGGMLLLGDEDAADGALIRPSLQACFRYRFSENWIGVGEFGFGWNAYKDQGDTVYAITSGTLGAYRHVSNALGVEWSAGGGAGLYRWIYKSAGKAIKDPESHLAYKGLDPGLFAGMQVEKRMTAHVTLIGTAQYHLLFSSNEDDFPTRFGGSDSFLASRLGVNYHFSPYEGILWERKVNRTIRLTSGKAGS